MAFRIDQGKELSLPCDSLWDSYLEPRATGRPLEEQPDANPHPWNRSCPEGALSVEASIFRFKSSAGSWLAGGLRQVSVS